MGCTTGKKSLEFKLPPPSTSSGILKITITNGVLFHQAGTFKMDPYIILKLSNQSYTSKVVQNGGKKPVFQQTFTFYINSQKIYGRNLKITLMDKKKIGFDNFIGYGMVDLNPAIDLKKQKDQFRCILSFQYQQAGFVNIIAQFIEEPPEILNFKFDQTIIRRNTSTFGNINCWLQVTIGEETIKTSKKKDTKQKPPTWKGQTFSIKTLSSIKHCVIKVMDDNQLIGWMEIPLNKLLAVDAQQFFVEDFHYNEGIYAGTLKFRTFKGKTPTFTQTQNCKNPYTDDKIAQNNAQRYFNQKMVHNHASF